MPSEQVAPLVPEGRTTVDEWFLSVNRSHSSSAHEPPKRFWTAYELLHAEFPEPLAVVDGLLTSGLYLLVGKPKIGKSWFALQTASAVAHGDMLLGSLPVVQTAVLMIALEDSPLRLQGRLKMSGVSDIRDLVLTTIWETGLRGIEWLRSYLSTYSDTKLVIIDTWGKLQLGSDGNDYNDTTRAASLLKAVADDFDVCILVVHHANKSHSEDYVDSVLGSTGLSGVADGVLVLKRQRGGTGGRLSITGRDIAESEFSLQFVSSNGIWIMAETGEEICRSPAQQAVFDALASVPTPMSPAEIASRLGRSSAGTRKLLQRMKEDGLVEQPEFGKYTVLRDCELEVSHSSHSSQLPIDLPNAVNCSVACCDNRDNGDNCDRRLFGWI